MSHTGMATVLDCGCVYMENGRRVMCPTCLGPSTPPPLSLRGAQALVTDWANEVFPDRTIKGTLAKLTSEELPELIVSGMKDELEYADALILVLDLAGQAGIDIEMALQRKMNINRGRKWRRDPDTGFYSHIKSGDEQ